MLDLDKYFVEGKKVTAVMGDKRDYSCCDASLTCPLRPLRGP